MTRPAMFDRDKPKTLAPLSRSLARRYWKGMGQRSIVGDHRRLIPTPALLSPRSVRAPRHEQQGLVQGQLDRHGGVRGRRSAESGRTSRARIRTATGNLARRAQMRSPANGGDVTSYEAGRGHTGTRVVLDPSTSDSVNRVLERRMGGRRLRVTRWTMTQRYFADGAAGCSEGGPQSWVFGTMRGREMTALRVHSVSLFVGARAHALPVLLTTVLMRSSAGPPAYLSRHIAAAAVKRWRTGGRSPDHDGSWAVAVARLRPRDPRGPGATPVMGRTGIVCGVIDAAVSAMLARLGLPPVPAWLSASPTAPEIVVMVLLGSDLGGVIKRSYSGAVDRGAAYASADVARRPSNRRVSQRFLSILRLAGSSS